MFVACYVFPLRSVHATTGLSDTYPITFVHLGTHRQLDNKPGSVPQDKGRDEVPVDDISQAADTPVRTTTGLTFTPILTFRLR